jgi:hypothetical protein
MTLNKRERQKFTERLQETSAISISSFLEYKGKVPAARDTFDAQIDKFLSLVDAGSLPVETIDEFLLSHYEGNSKRVFVLDATIPAGHNAFLAQMDRLTAQPTARDLKLGTQIPVHSYSHVTNVTAKAVWVEQHRIFRIDSATEQIIVKTVPRVVVAVLNRKTGRMHVQLDNPQKHTHGAGASAFFEEYLLRARVTLGVQTTSAPLSSWMHDLKKQSCVTWVKHKGQGANTRFSITADGSDLRNTAGYKSMVPNLIRDLGADCLWLRNKPSPHPTAPSLVRDVRTKIDCDSSMVVFEQHTLQNEIDYVLAHIP